MSKMIEIASQADFSLHLATLSPSTLLIVYFYTPWAEYSTQMSTGMSTIASQCPDTVTQTTSFVRINAIKLVDIAKEYKFPVAPYVLCLRSDQVLESIRGSDSSKVRNAIGQDAGVDAIVVSALLADPAPTMEKSKEEKEVLIARLTQMVKSAPIVLFMKGTPKSPLCRFSRRMVAILNEHYIQYDSFNILADEDVREGLKEFGDWPTFPQLWIDGQLVGGLEIVREEIITDAKFIRQYSVAKAVGG
ncbi:thioredoxin [Penicillium waksmanii]|uniref:thioredoxin n=1 Tax=Penicillium waksmanii TaxID=69791 RepID=UPI00254682F4|nr:thioredoxin [Penicillium waksmanii]KAJ5974984.1 thioredoxin [Penicillium waksmanii]